MKKLYIIPTVSFEALEEESLLIGESHTHLMDKTNAAAPVTTTSPDIKKMDLFNDTNTGGMFAYDEESDE